MRMPITPDGWPIIAAATLICGAAAAIAVAAGWWPAAIAPTIVWGWAISFFRDPHRHVVAEPGELLAPADGRVTEVSRVAHDETIGGPAIRVSIFLSIFNVHVNRAACAGVIRDVHYRKGRFLAAFNPDAGECNEANTLVVEPDSPLSGPVVLRQIAGLIARRIVCRARPGDRLAAGQRFGMIRFGSRTDLIVPDTPGIAPVVRVGQRVRAGLDVLVRQRRVEKKESVHAPDAGAQAATV